MNARQRLVFGAAVASACLALGAGTASADPSPRVGGCASGFDLRFIPVWDAALVHSNGDGWVCVNTSPADHQQGQGNANLWVFIDNIVPSKNAP